MVRLARQTRHCDSRVAACRGVKAGVRHGILSLHCQGCRSGEPHRFCVGAFSWKWGKWGTVRDGGGQSICACGNYRPPVPFGRAPRGRRTPFSARGSSRPRSTTFRTASACSTRRSGWSFSTSAISRTTAWSTDIAKPGCAFSDLIAHRAERGFLARGHRRLLPPDSRMRTRRARTLSFVAELPDGARSSSTIGRSPTVAGSSPTRTSPERRHSAEGSAAGDFARGCARRSSDPSSRPRVP